MLQIACFILIAWAVWSCLSSDVDDGIIGKSIFAGIALSATSILFGAEHRTGSSTLTAFFAAYAIRQVWMRYAWKFIRKQVKL